MKIQMTSPQIPAQQQMVRHRDPGGPRDPNTSADGQAQRSWWTLRSKHISRWPGTEILVDPEIQTHQPMVSHRDPGGSRDPNTSADGQAQRSWWIPRSKHISRWSGTEILVDPEIQTHQQMVRHRDPGGPQDPNTAADGQAQRSWWTLRSKHISRWSGTEILVDPKIQTHQ